MKIITITGECGTGKDTLANKLVSTIPNSRHIAGDQYMFDSVKYYKTIVEKIFSNVQYLQDGNIEYSTVFNNTPKENEKFVPYIIKYVSECFDIAIEKALKDNINILVLQWIGIHKCDCWNNSNLRLHMKADKNARHQALLNRKEDGCDNETAKKRDEHWKNTIKTIEGVDLTIDNSQYSQIQLDKVTKNIKEIIRCKENDFVVIGGK